MIRLLTEGQVAYGSKTTATAASGNELSPVVLAVIIGIALGAFVFYGICKVGRNEGRKEQYIFFRRNISFCCSYLPFISDVILYWNSSCSYVFDIE